MLINRKPVGYFPVARGVKQGDSLSPLFFILASEGFLRGIKALIMTGHISGFQAGRVPQISHLGFDDDLVIFLNGSTQNLQHFWLFLDSYQQASGQLVNYHKSQVVARTGVFAHRILLTLEMRLSSLPIKYIGSFLYKGVNRADYCVSLLAHFNAKLNSCSSTLLSTTGRVVKIRHILSSMPLHIIASSKLQKCFASAESLDVAFLMEWASSLESMGECLPPH